MHNPENAEGIQFAKRCLDKLAKAVTLGNNLKANVTGCHILNGKVVGWMYGQMDSPSTLRVSFSYSFCSFFLLFLSIYIYIFIDIYIYSYIYIYYIYIYICSAPVSVSMSIFISVYLISIDHM